VTKHEQAKLLEAILDNMKAAMMAKVDRFPENWDGIEIRQYLADHGIEIRQYLADQFALEARPMHRKRLRNYRNDVITRPL
jgi:hypothetical protein